MVGSPRTSSFGFQIQIAAGPHNVSDQVFQGGLPGLNGVHREKEETPKGLLHRGSGSPSWPSRSTNGSTRALSNGPTP